MSRWWRAYDDAVDHPKLGRLSDALHRAWFNLCCISSSNGGMLPTIDDIAFKLRMKPEKVRVVIADLAARRLVDIADNGPATMHDWHERQFKTDVTDSTNADRQQRYRDRHRNGVTTVTDAVTVTDTRAETEQITETEKKDIRAVADATRPSVEKVFDEEFWPIYPKRDGANPKKPAKNLFVAAVKSGRDPMAIVAGAMRYRDAMRAKGEDGTAYVAQAMTWLRQARWEDYATAPPGAVGEPVYLKPPPGQQSLEEIRKASNGVPHAEDSGTKIRDDPGVGEDGADRPAEL